MIKINDYNIINYTELSREEALMVLEWRNSDFVKHSMDNTDSISVKDHFQYIEKLKSQNDKIYFLVQRDDEYLGCIYFQDVTESDAELGLFINPIMKGRGIGSLLISIIERFAKEILNIKKLKLKVKKSNTAAIRLYEKDSYIRSRDDLIYIYMSKELNGEL